MNNTVVDCYLMQIKEALKRSKNIPEIKKQSFYILLGNRYSSKLPVLLQKDNAKYYYQIYTKFDFQNLVYVLEDIYRTVGEETLDSYKNVSINVKNVVGKCAQKQLLSY